MAGGSPGNFSTRLTKIPPDKGSFPIDHDNACKGYMVQFMKCLRDNKFDNEKCRPFSKDYLECRMQQGLMAKEDWKNLGYKESG
jgi:cytochrome c oxidase assembly protein subunit 19